ncbi:HdeD family acid-resistance protein [Nitrosovibrio tenuis]|uniref:Uncharacterized membrane protein HdeD, DUF308 family n=1 Tax=Nitrosovibrio tenuis TaxID=1233 RepID=A0A1H7IIS7_9PROT|nr:DUF308 domain-containing protein [Nitrosovibrio tenuis]SEK62379.1 Uncharacterized membrane protein HdeD, DUF308 family [Nitrosovibrio tenuis]
MNELLLKSWKVLALRGAVSLLFGVLAALWPGLTLMWLIVMFAAYALIWGAVSMSAAVRNRKSNDDWWMLLVLGLIGLAAGATTILYPGLTALMLVLLMGATALASGIVDIAMAIRLRKVIQGEGFLILNGIVSILFGVFVFFFPGAGALAMVWLISMYAIVTGMLLLALAWRVRSWTSEHGTPPESLPAHG